MHPLAVNHINPTGCRIRCSFNIYLDNSERFFLSPRWHVLLTAFDGVWRRLQRNGPAIGLVDVDPKHQPHTCVFTPNVCFSFAKLDVRIAQF